MSERTFVVVGHGEEPRTDLVGMLDEFSATGLERATRIAKRRSRKNDYQGVTVEVAELDDLDNYCYCTFNFVSPNDARAMIEELMEKVN